MTVLYSERKRFGMNFRELFVRAGKNRREEILKRLIKAEKPVVIYGTGRFARLAAEAVAKKCPRGGYSFSTQ